MKTKNIEIEKEEENYNPELISYKGEKVQKKKLVEDFLSRSSETGIEKYNEKNRLYEIINYDEYIQNSTIKLEIKSKVMSWFSQIKNKKIDKLDTVCLLSNDNVGNSLVRLNNAIFYCEIIGCNKVILPKKSPNRKWLISNPIYIKKLKITIMLGTYDCNDDNVICVFGRGLMDPYYFKIVRPQVRIQYIKEELLRNIPKVKTKPNDLYIHLRAGDVFNQNPPSVYAQPPLCFYQKIIDNNKFKNIYIVASDKKNIITDALINKYNYIKFQSNDYRYDLSLLIHAYNLAISISSFSVSAIKFNDNLKDLWEYDIFRLSEKFLILHYHLYKYDYKYNIHTMRSSDIYADKMFYWKKSDSQLKLMLEDICTYDFVLTKPNR